jgi:hypothetical protein
MACANQDVAAMQTAANRFGTHMFSDYQAIAVDCIAGGQTWDAVTSSLYEISPVTTDQVDEPTQNQALSLYADLNSYSDLTNAAADIANVLNSASDQLGYGPAPAAPAVQPARSGLRTNKPTGVPVSLKLKTAATSLFGLGLPAPVVYIAGAALGIGITALVVARLKKR